MSRVWAISDLHLSPPAMVEGLAQFNDAWVDHPGPLLDNWRQVIGAEDWVLCPGDITAATAETDPHGLVRDLVLLDQLPGQKLVGPGNHDHFQSWADVGQVGGPRSYFLLDADAMRIGPENGPGLVVAGTSGWPAPEDPGFGIYVEVFGELEARRRYQEELEKLDRALRLAAVDLQPGDSLVVLHHHPPYGPGRRRTAASARIAGAGAVLCLYGHLHRPEQWAEAVTEVSRGCRYQLVAADYLDMRPLLVGELGSTGFELSPF